MANLIGGKQIEFLNGVTATTAELNIMDGVTSTYTELNIMDGGTSATGTTLADADRLVSNDNGTMKQVALTDFETYFETSLDTLSNVTTVGALNAGSITSGFGTIDTGSSTITTTGLISGGSLDIDDVLINGTTIGHTDDTDLMTVADGLLTVAGEISVTTLDIGGTNVTSTAAELNLLDGVSGLVQADLTKLAAVDSTAAEINLIDGGTARGTTAVASGDGILINDDGTMRMTNVDTVSTYFASHSVGGGNMVTTGALDSGSITSGFGTIDTGSSNITTTGTVSAGNLTVTGTTTTVNSTVMTVVDPIINLQTASGGGAIGSDTNKDVGLAMHYHTGSAAKIAFLGYDDSAGKLTFVTDATLSSEVVSGTAGTIVADLEGTVQTATQGSITSLGTLTTLTVDNVIINGTTIGHTGDDDLMTVASGILTVAGEISVTTLDIGGTNVTSTAAELNRLDGIGSAAVGLTDSQTLTNKTLTSPVLNTAVSGTAVLDEDTMSSDSATQLATQQSIKAYIASQSAAMSVALG